MRTKAGYDVVVVGAGITGASTAYHLARQGVATALVERNHPASGPTGRSSALTHAFYLLPELSRLAARGTDLLRNLADLTGGTSDYEEVGMLWAVGPDDASEWSQAVARIRREGAEIEALSVEQLADLAPEFELEGVAMGVWEPTGGYADPSSSTQSLVDAARRDGAQVLTNTAVRRLLVEGERVVGVETEHGERVEADAVVVAAGPWTKPLIGQVGVDLPLFIERHGIAVVDVPGRARAVLPFSWCDDTTSHYARPEGDSLILVGTWAGGGTGHRNAGEELRPDALTDPDRYDEHVDQDESSWILGHMAERVPAVSKLGLRRGYAGLYDMSPDDLPIIDRVPGAEGLHVAAGTSGHGFKLGPAVGEELARLVTTGASELLEPFRLDREFPPQ